MTIPALTHSTELEGFRGLLRFAADPLGSLEEARRLHGPFVCYRQSRGDVRLVFDPELVDELMVGGADHVIKDEFTRQLRPVMGEGLLTSEGQPWKKQRKLLAPSFQPKHLRAYASVMVDCAEAMVDNLHGGGVRSIHADMMHLTLEVVVRTLFGSSVVRANEVERLLDQVTSDYRRLLMSWRAAFPGWFPFYSRIRFGRARKQLRKVIDELISERRRAPPGNDMLSRLLEAKDDAGRGMSEQQLLDEAITVLIAGHETTALTLCYALDQLARHPTELAVLERELAEVLAGRSPRFEDVPRLRYCGAVVKETLRLYPPAWATGREVVTELTLGGVKLPPGTLLLVSPWVVQRDARFFREPLRFRPDRWLNGETDGLPKLAYFPFGAGPRVCIGSHFAELEAALLLATLTSRCTFSLTSEAPLLLSPSVTLRPRGPMEMRVAVRDRPS